MSITLKTWHVIAIIIIGWSVPFAAGYFTSGRDFDTGWNACLRQVMRVKNTDQWNRLSPDVKRALSQMERVKISSQIAGAGHEE